MSTEDDSSDSLSNEKATKNKTAPEGLCEVCLTKCSLRCAGCKTIFYCCKDHQSQHWKTHKTACAGKKHKRQTMNAQAAAMLEKMGLTPPTKGFPSILPNSVWSKGFKSSKEMYEWLVDCYRMRVDDDYVWGGYNLHGLYDPDSTKVSIAEDFLVFAKLALKLNAIPAQNWSWEEFLIVAGQLLGFAFEKSDAQEKYGGENVFDVAMGGRSLRFTAEVIYETGIQGEQDLSTNQMTVENEISELRRGGKGENYDSVFIPQNAAYFKDVGGWQRWRKLVTHIKK